MGVYINLDIMPDHIKSADWEKVYHETLELVQAYPFLDSVVDEETYTRPWAYTTETVEREIPFCEDEVGWHTVGDGKSMKEAESFFLVKDLNFYRRECRSGGDCDDILFFRLHQMDVSNEHVNSIKVRDTAVFDGKTQGLPYHIPLLGIACLIECRFPKHAQVWGDISIGQMKEAVKWANSILKDPITLTERANDEKVLQRIEAVIEDERAVLEILMKLTLNEKSMALGDLVRAHFQEDIIRAYYKDVFEWYEPGIYGFSNVLSDYLVQGFTLESACELCVLDPKGCCYDAQEFVRAVLEIHWPDNDSAEGKELPLEINAAESTAPETVYSLFGKSMMKMAGMQNTIDSDLTYDEVVAVLERKMDEVCDVRALETKDSRAEEEELDHKINEMFHEKMNAFEEMQEKYTINDIEDLIVWEKGDTINPNIVEFIKRIREFILEKERENNGSLEPFDSLPKALKADYVIEHNRYFPIRKEVWEFVFENVENKPFVHRFLRILLIKAEALNVNHLCKALANNRFLFEEHIMGE